MKTKIRTMAALGLILSLLLGLTACARGPETAGEPPTEQAGESPAVQAGEAGAEDPDAEGPEEEPIPAQEGEVQLLAEASRPALPEAPDVAAVIEADDAIWARDDLSDEERSRESEALWDEYRAQEEAYEAALSALRGEDVENGAAFRSFTEAVATALLSGTENNTVFSPANLYLALSMLAEVTQGDSQAQLLGLLAAEDAGSLRTLCRRVWENLYLDEENSKTLLANAVFLRDGLQACPEPLEALAQDYYASVYSVPMGSEAADKALQAFLNENTGGLLEESAGSQKTNPRDLLILASALYFKGAFVDEFSEALTAPGDFTTASGAVETADFMHKTRQQTAAVGDGYAVAALPFAGQGSIVFLLPDEGVSLHELLSTDALEKALTLSGGEGQTIYEVSWSVPKFDVASELELPDTLRALGVSDVFVPGEADFSPLLGDTIDALPAVSAITHAARVTLDEKGCEAAAFTAIAVADGAFSPDALPALEMDLSRPFLFLITGLDGLPLFVGAVQHP